MKALPLLIVLAACAAETLPLPPPASPMPVEGLTPAAPVAAKAPAAAVVQREYQAVERKEIPAITGADVSAEYVKRVHDADIAARRAVRVLERPGRPPSPEAIGAARRAVRDLADVLGER